MPRIRPASQERSPLSPLADPARQAIFDRLIAGPKAVKMLAAELPISQPAVSQHLKVMKEAGLLSEQREGRYRLYGIRPEVLERLSMQFSGLRDQVLDADEAQQAQSEYDPIDSSMEHWAQTWQEHDPLSVGVIVRLRLVAKYLETLSERSAARFNLSNAQVLLLATLDRPETPRESTLTELSRICHISLTATSRHIERTERRGLIVRRPDENDARSQLIRITDKGRELLHQILRSQRDHEHAPVYRMSMEERLRLAKLLRPLLRNLQETLDE
jgi:DNA-binding MarR family transcriptional regulator